VFKKGTALVPSYLAFAVVTLLEKHFGELVDYAFTARMEGVLDDIAHGEAARVPWLRQFYFGGDQPGTPAAGGDGASGAPEALAVGGTGLKALVSDIDDIDPREVSSFPLDGTDITVRVGRYGPYLERDGQRVNVPEDMAPDELTPERAEELLNQPSEDRVLGTDPDTGLPVVAKSGRFGPYVTELPPEDAPASAKPRTASLLKSMSLGTVTLDEALKLLSLPRTIGELDGEPVTAQNGRYGPYVKKGTDSRSLGNEEQLFTLTLAEAKDLFSQPKARGRARGAAAPPLRELGDDPGSGKPMVVKSGRFGPYVTDGETNASLRKGDDVDTLSVQRAAELLADRRATAPSRPAPRRAAARPAPRRTATVKPAAAKKPAPKKTTAAKTAAKKTK
jgi:DNA topoisomerase-1